MNSTSRKFETQNIPETWAELFRKAGILNQELSDSETFRTLLSTIGDRLTPLDGGPSGGEQTLRRSRVFAASLDANNDGDASDGAGDDTASIGASNNSSSLSNSSVSPKHLLLLRARNAVRLALEIDVDGITADDM